MDSRKRILALFGAVLTSAAAVNAAAATVVFEDTFTGSPTNATRTLGAGATITNTTPLSGGDYVHTNFNLAAGGSAVIATYTPSNAAWNSLVGSNVVVGANNFLNLNGGFDVFFRANNTETTTEVISATSWFRPIDVEARTGVTGVRMVLNGINTQRMNFEMAGASGTTNFKAATSTSAAFTSFGAQSAMSFGNLPVNAALTIAEGSIYHYGLTFDTNQTTGEIRLRIFGAQGDGAIDTTSNTNLLWERFFYGNGAALSANGTQPVLRNTDWTFTSRATVASTVDVDWDRYTVYSGTVSGFAAIPEPASMGLMALSALSLFRRRSK